MSGIKAPPTTFEEAVKEIYRAVMVCRDGFGCYTDGWNELTQAAGEICSARRVWRDSPNKQAAFLWMIQHGSPALLELGVCGLRDDYSSCQMSYQDAPERIEA